MEEFRSYLKDIRQFPDFREQGSAVSTLVKKMNEGDNAAALSLIESTLKYILELSRNHCRQWNASQNLMDLVQEANIEVSEKIRKFDPSKAALKEFISFRCYVAFVGFWKKSKTVHLTDHGRKILKNLQRVQNELAVELGREPTLEELSTRMGADESQVYSLQSQSSVTMLAIRDQNEDESNHRAADLDAVGCIRFDPFQPLEANELRQILIACLEIKGADLLLASLDGTRAFQSLYSQIYGKDISAAAARKQKERLLKKLKSCPEAKEKLFHGYR
jgi:DNA-directed RNA polymerase specialized sigma subunit